MDFNELASIISQYGNASPSAPPPQVEQHYDQVAGSAPRPQLASALAQAFRSDSTPSFGEMVGNLFSNSNGEQRAGILNHLLGVVGPGLLGTGALGSLAGLLQGARPAVTPEQATGVPPDTVRELADRAKEQDPSIVDRASEFYAQHPTLVKALGVGTLALILSHMRG